MFLLFPMANSWRKELSSSLGCCVFSLTQEDEHAQQDGNEGSGAENSRGQEGLSPAHWRPGPALARTHPERKRAGAAEDGLSSIPHNHRQLVQLLFCLAESLPAHQHACAAICQREQRFILAGCMHDDVVQQKPKKLFAPHSRQLPLENSFLNTAFCYFILKLPDMVLDSSLLKWQQL